MLPLVSSAIPRLTGTRSALKCVTVCQLAVFVHDEVLLVQAGDEPAARIGHARGDVDQLDATLEAESGLGTLGRRLLRVQRNDNQRDRRERSTEADDRVHS